MGRMDVAKPFTHAPFTSEAELLAGHRQLVPL